MADAPQIPGYKIVRPLGVGGMASVYLAVQESLDREVALKVMAPALAANEEFTQRFLKEGRITAKLSHPNLVTVFDIGQHGTHYYLAAEYIPGGTLRDRMAKGISIAEALDVARETAHGLHFAHEKGFVHRDVKPGNILFKHNGTAVLADFGIAKAMGSGTMATQVGNSIGTPHYMSPEQARAETVDGRSDLYSLGAMLFEMLTGKPPYDAPDPFTIALMHVTHPVPQLPAEFQWMQPLIERLMAKNADERYPNGEAFIAAVDQLVASAPEAASIHEATQASARKRPVTRFSSTGEQRRGERRAEASAPSRGLPLLPVGLAAVALLLVGGGVAWVAMRADPAPTPGATTTDPTASPTALPSPEPTPIAVSPPVTDLTVDSDVPVDDIDALVERAQAYVKQGITENGRRLASPPGDCAIDLFLRVLELEPGNAEARAGLDQIAAFFESKAKASYDRGFYSGSLVLAEEGLRAKPEDPGLRKLLEDSRKAAGF